MHTPGRSIARIAAALQIAAAGVASLQGCTLVKALVHNFSDLDDYRGGTTRFGEYLDQTHTVAFVVMHDERVGRCKDPRTSPGSVDWASRCSVIIH